jgi:predicted 3-demethylubiquinone-9 3-methyltransferase (glyoxalase superfamily)
MSKITPTLWFDGQVEEAAAFYVSLLPDSRIEQINRSSIGHAVGTRRHGADCHSDIGRAEILPAERRADVPQTEAVSFMIETEDQAENDRLYNAIVSNGRRGKRLRLVQGPVGRVLASDAQAPARTDHRPRPAGPSAPWRR